MSFIPKEHQKYNILPNSRKGSWEVISYDSDLFDELVALNIDIPSPYQPDNLESYYNEINDCINLHPEHKTLLLDYIDDLKIRNDKSKWSILKYVGESDDNFTNNRYYYVPTFEKDGKVQVDGIIDDEEFTSYVGWSIPDGVDCESGITSFSKEGLKDFIVIEDPYNVFKK